MKHWLIGCIGTLKGKRVNNRLTIRNILLDQQRIEHEVIEGLERMLREHKAYLEDIQTALSKEAEDEND